MALRALSANRMRAALTMLGVVIGVAAVITLVSVGQGAQQQVSGELTSLGTNLITIVPGRGTVLEASDADYIRKAVPSLGASIPFVQVTTEVAFQSNTKVVQVHGSSPEYKEIRSYKVEAGRFIMPQDLTDRHRVAVVGRTVVDEVFEGKNPIGETLSIKGQPFKVVGTLEKKGSSFGIDNDSIVIVPYTTLQRLAGTRRISAIYAQAKDVGETDEIVEAIRTRFDIRFRRGDSVIVTSQEQLLSLVSTITGTFTVLLASIAGISLLVGGIGIMNIMLVSVTERTREIGLRKAIGARNSDILVQFLVEAGVLSGSGGTFGILLGFAGSRLIARVGNLPSYTSINAIIMGFGVSLAIGLFFGLYPAAKASRMDPISALRYE